MLKNPVDDGLSKIMAAEATTGVCTAFLFLRTILRPSHLFQPVPLGDEGELSKEYLWTYSTTILAAVLFGACSSLLAVAICEEEDGDSSRSSAALV
jgi:hypothetical protein